MPDRPQHSQDNFYRKGQFHVKFDVNGAKVEDEDALDEAIMVFLWALQNETGLKVSSFFDVIDIDEPESDDSLAERDTSPTAHVEFVIYNKLGITALGKLNRFFNDHIHEAMRNPAVTLHGGGDTFRANNFRMQYLFLPFTYGREPDDWDKLRELLGQDDHGYRELTARKPPEEKEAHVLYRGAHYITIEAACADRVFVGTGRRGATRRTHRSIRAKPSTGRGALREKPRGQQRRRAGPRLRLRCGAGRHARHANHLRVLFGDDAEASKPNSWITWAVSL